MTANNQPKSTVLKDARLAKGLTLDLVHEATKIPLDALKAIEEGYSVRMLTPFYFKGFIKIYAEFLGLDVKEVFVHYGLDKPPLPKPTPMGKISAEQQGAKAPNQLLSKLFTVKNLSLLGRVLILLIALWGIFKLGGCVVDAVKKWPKPVAKAQDRVIKKEVKKVEVVAEEEEKPVIKKSVTEKVIGAVSVDQGVELAVRANRDSWLQVKADDKVVFQMTMKKGTTESWVADKRIELTGKNINELDIEVNGKHIGMLGSSERKAKRVIITKDGLTVKK